MFGKLLLPKGAEIKIRNNKVSVVRQFCLLKFWKNKMAQKNPKRNDNQSQIMSKSANFTFR